MELLPPHSGVYCYDMLRLRSIEFREAGVSGNLPIQPAIPIRSRELKLFPGLALMGQERLVNGRLGRLRRS